jgi:hypothetical protein
MDPAAASPITHHFGPKQEAIDAHGDVNRPRYWWLADEWSNLYLSCQRCATAAGEVPGGRFSDARWHARTRAAAREAAAPRPLRGRPERATRLPSGRQHAR